MCERISTFKRRLFIFSAYAPMDYSADSQKNEIDDKLTCFICKRKSTDIVVATCDFNSQTGKFSGREACLGGYCDLPVRCIDNQERLLQSWTDSHLFLSSTSFRYNARRTTKDRSKATGYVNRIDHIPVRYRSRGFVPNYGSHELEYALVPTQLSVQFNGHQYKLHTRLVVQRLSSPDFCTCYEQKLSPIEELRRVAMYISTRTERNRQISPAVVDPTPIKEIG